MESLRIIQRPQNGQLVIEVPKEMSNVELEVVVSIKRTNDFNNRIKIAQKFRSIMPLDGYVVQDDDVYEQ